MKKIFLVIKKEDSSVYEEISQENLDLVRPVLEAIKNFVPYYTKSPDGTINYCDNNYPTVTSYKRFGEKRAEELYGHLPGFKILDKILHNPYFRKIYSIKILYTNDN